MSRENLRVKEFSQLARRKERWGIAGGEMWGGPYLDPAKARLVSGEENGKAWFQEIDEELVDDEEQ